MRHSLMTLLRTTLALALIIGAIPVAAQAPVTSADIQRLQDDVYDAGRDVAAVRDRDPRLADSLQAQLDDLRDEAVYLKVKQRKESGVTRAEYTNLHDRIDRLRSQTRPEPVRSSSSPTEIPVGTEFEVRLQTRLNSGTAKVEDRFDATTLSPFEKNGRSLVPAGSVMRGVVNSVTPASRGLSRKGSMTLLFDRFSIDGRTYSIRATVTQAIEGSNDT